MIEIIQGERQPFTIDLILKSSKKPFDLTGFSEITACFKADSSKVVLTEGGGDISVVGDPKLGQLTGFLTVAQTTSLTPTAKGDIEVVIDFGLGDIKKTQILNQFIVQEGFCP